MSHLPVRNLVAQLTPRLPHTDRSGELRETFSIGVANYFQFPYGFAKLKRQFGMSPGM